MLSLGLAGLTLTSLPASALDHHYRGRIVGFANQGLYLRVGSKVTYVPWSGYAFYLGGAPIGAGAELSVGTVVDAYAQPPIVTAQPSAVAPTTNYPTQQYPARSVPINAETEAAGPPSTPPADSGCYSPTYSVTEAYPYAPAGAYDYEYPYYGYYGYGPYLSLGWGFGWPYWGGGYWGGYRGSYRGGYRGAWAGGYRGGGYRGGGGGYRGGGGAPGGALGATAAVDDAEQEKA